MTKDGNVLSRIASVKTTKGRRKCDRCSILSVHLKVLGEAFSALLTQALLLNDNINKNG